MRFTEFLIETEEQFITDPVRIHEHIDRYRKHRMSIISNIDPLPKKKYVINSDGSVSVDSGFTLSLTYPFFINGQFPFKFKETGGVSLDTAELKSYIGMPDKINGHLYISSPRSPQSFEGFSSEITRKISVEFPNSFSFEGIHNHLKKMENGEIYLPTKYYHGLLSFLMIEGIREISIYGMYEAKRELRQAVSIINQNLKTGGDVISCKKEMIAAGLERYAKL